MKSILPSPTGFHSLMGLLIAGAGLAALPVLAQAPEAAPAAAAVAEAAGEAAKVEVVKGDVAWMMVSTLLVTFMAVPGLALFYGGLVRTKNMLSVLMQVSPLCSAEPAGISGSLASSIDTSFSQRVEGPPPVLRLLCTAAYFAELRFHPCQGSAQLLWVWGLAVK